MDNKRAYTAAELAERLKAELVGKGNVELRSLASLRDAGPEDLSFYSGTTFTGATYAADLARTRAGALLMAKHDSRLDVPQILVPDPFLAANELMNLFYPPTELEFTEGIHPLAAVADSAQIGEGARIMPFVSVGAETKIGARAAVHPGAQIGRHVRIGEDCLIWSNVVVREGTVIGSRVIIHPGAVIGSDGFGYARREGKFVKIRHVGIVVIEDDVEIGANATIDRATLGRTIIRRGVKLDNLVHIAHNVDVGEDSAMAAQCGISGSTVIGERVLMGGQTGLVDHLRIGDDAVFIAQSGVIGDIPSGAVVSGYPARPHREVLRAHAEMRHLSRLRHKVRELEKRLSRLVDEKAP